MTLYKLTQKETKENHYAKDRKDIRRLTNLSETSITKLLAKLRKGNCIVNTRQFIIDLVEIDETSIKEIHNA